MYLFSNLRRSLIVLGVALWLPSVAMTARADTFTLNFLPANTFSGTAPAGSLTATFSDVTNGVQLVIQSSLVGNENLDPNKALYLNLDPSDNNLLGKLTFTLESNIGFGQQAVVEQGRGKHGHYYPDQYKADGTGGYYDLLFTYHPSTKAFKGGEEQTYLITATGGTITADDFDFPSYGGGEYLAAVHVQNTPTRTRCGSGSGWVDGTLPPPTTTPEPGSMALMGTFVLAACGAIRRRLMK